MISAIAKATAQCFTRPFLGTLIKAFVVAVVLLAGLSWLLIWLAHFLPAMPWAWLNATLSVLVTLGTALAAVLLASPVAMIVIGLFLEEIAAKVERRYYPALGPPRHEPFLEGLSSALGLASLTLLLNLLALPIYIFLPGLNLVVYFVLNGGLIGREYYLLAAARRLTPDSQRALRRRHGFVIFLAGCLIAFVLVIPGVNFVGPLFGTALMVHLVEQFRAKVGAPSSGEAVQGARARADDGAGGLRGG